MLTTDSCLSSQEYIEKKGINYTILDISEDELKKAPSGYKKLAANIASPELSLGDVSFDLVFSKMLAEHIRNGEQFHKNILRILARKGLAIHFFPTMYSFPFIVNKLVPERLADKLLNIFAPRDRYQHEKFPAYYSWCYGPTRKQMHEFNSLGYEVIEYRGFYGHSYYRKVAPLRMLHDVKTRFFLRNPNPNFVNYAYVVLKKP